MFTLYTFYRSDEWETLLAQLKLERTNENDELLCEHCHKPIIFKYDCIGHHKIELTELNVNDYNISLNPDNIMLVHHKCHNQIHERFGYERPKKIYIVFGSPCSGKTTWVKDVATKDDIIVDIDNIWECISVCDKYHKPNRLKANAFGLRDTLLEQIRTRLGKWKNAYIIGTYPLKMERVRLANKLGAELIFVDTEKDICLSRCVNDEWKQYVNDWFESYQK